MFEDHPLAADNPMVTAASLVAFVEEETVSPKLRSLAYLPDMFQLHSDNINAISLLNPVVLERHQALLCDLERLEEVCSERSIKLWDKGKTAELRCMVSSLERAMQNA